MNKLLRSPAVADESTGVTHEPDVIAEAPEESYDIEVRGVVDKIYQVTGKRGKGKGILSLMFKPDLASANPFANIVRMVGAENWNRVVLTDILNQACRDTSKVSVDENGMLSVGMFADAFPNWFLPSSRKGGPGIKEFKEELLEITEELQPFMLVAAQGKTIPVADQPRFGELLAQWNDLNEKIEAKSRKGKKAK